MYSKTTTGGIIKRSKELGLDLETVKLLTEKELKKLLFNELLGR